MSSTDVAAGKPPAKQELQKPMKESRSQKMEAGIRAHFETEQEIEGLKETIDGLRRDVQARDMELASLRERLEQQREDHSAVLNAAESRATSAQAERDKAVSETTALKVIIASMKRVFEMAPQ